MTESEWVRRYPFDQLGPSRWFTLDGVRYVFTKWPT